MLRPPVLQVLKVNPDIRPVYFQWVRVVLV
jgi:hypothetical protein